MRLILLVALALSACSPPEPVTMSTALQCRTRVRCDVVTWSVGTKHALHVAGYHGGCQCLDPEELPP